MLPIKERPPSSGTAPLNRELFAAQFGSVLPPFNPATLGMGIGAAIRNAREADRLELANALAHLRLKPKQFFTQVLAREIRLNSLPITMIDDQKLELTIQNGSFQNLPQDVQAILDIKIHDAAYYPARKAGGFTPYFNISATLWDTVNPGETVDDFYYSGDYNDARGNPRYFTTSAELSSPDLLTFQTKAEKYRAGLTALFERVALMLIGDVQRVLKKQKRLG